MKLHYDPATDMLHISFGERLEVEGFTSARASSSTSMPQTTPQFRRIEAVSLRVRRMSKSSEARRRLAMSATPMQAPIVSRF